jgi:hypothetical protein
VLQGVEHGTARMLMSWDGESMAAAKLIVVFSALLTSVLGEYALQLCTVQAHESLFHWCTLVIMLHEACLVRNRGIFSRCPNVAVSPPPLASGAERGCQNLCHYAMLFSGSNFNCSLCWCFLRQKSEIGLPAVKPFYPALTLLGNETDPGQLFQMIMIIGLRRY